MLWISRGKNIPVTCVTLCHGCHPRAFASMINRRRISSALVQTVQRSGMTRTCLFTNPQKANGADVTGVFTHTVGYRRNPASRPYGRYDTYGSVLDKRSVSILRVSTTSGHNVSRIHTLHRDIGFVPIRKHGGIFVVSRTRVLAART